MNENKTICEKGEFIDEVFGENVEYVRIYDEKGITIIFGTDNKIIVKEFKDTKELIEKFIEKYIECEFSDKIWQEQDEEFERLQEENTFLRKCLIDTLNCTDDKIQKIYDRLENQEV